MAQILDYSAGYPGAVNIARNFAGGIRYLLKEGSSIVRPLTRAEVLDYQSHGLALGLIYQHVSKSRVLEGRAAGRHDATWALTQARAVGIEPRAIYFAVDFDTISFQQWAAVREYMLGAGEVLGLARVGTYGEYDLLDYLFARESITWGWQTYAWSTGHNKDNQPRHPRAHLFQRAGQITVGGVLCDVNDVLARDGDFGQHPAPNKREDDMDSVQDQRLKNVEEWLQIIATNGWEPFKPGQPRNDPPAGGDLSWFQRQMASALQPVLERLDKLEARPAADVDEDALAAALAEHGLADAISIQEMKQLLTGLRFSLGPPTEGN